MTGFQYTGIVAAIQAGFSTMQIGAVVTGGVATRLLFVGAGPVLAQDADLQWHVGGPNLQIGASAGTTYGITSIGSLEISTAQGLKLGAAPAELIGCYGAAPVAQPTAGGVTAGYTGGISTPVTIDGTFTGNVGATAYTLADVVAALKLLGLIAS